jgi:hypothetical protein
MVSRESPIADLVVAEINGDENIAVAFVAVAVGVPG